MKPAKLTEADLDAAQAERSRGDTARRQAALDRAIGGFHAWADLRAQARTVPPDHPALLPSRCRRLHPVQQAAHDLHHFSGWRAAAWALAAVLVGVLSGVAAPWGWL